MEHPINRFQSMVMWVCRITKFDVEWALRQQWRAGKAAGVEEGRKEKTDCLRCPLYTQEQIRAGMQEGTITTGRKTTIQGARQRHVTRDLQQHPGTLMRHDRQMREQKRRAGDGPYTEMLPST